MKLVYYVCKVGKLEIVVDMCVWVEEVLVGREKDEYLLLYFGLFIVYYFMIYLDWGWEYVECCIFWSLNINMQKKYCFLCDMVEVLSYEFCEEVSLFLLEEFLFYWVDGIYLVVVLCDYFYK